MANEPTTPLPDPAVVERVLTALDQGIAAEPAALMAAIDAPEHAIVTVLATLDAYRQQVASERQQQTVALPPVDDELPAGTRLGDYVIEATLGRGAMGVVYRARQLSLGSRIVALKVLPSALVHRDPRFAERFRREARLAATIHHPNLAEVYGFEESGGTLCFAMRLVEGRPLHEILATLARGYQGEIRSTSAEYVRNCARLAQRLAGALAEIHAQGLIHRDVKPANVMLEGADPSLGEEALTAQPVLVDFGLLRPQGDTELTGTKTLLGTPSYAAHETQLGRDVDARADVFSLGALLHDLLTVTAPGARGPATSGMPDVRSINPRVDGRLAAIVDMALQERRELRYAHGGVLCAELDRYLRGEPVHALPTGALSRLRLWTRRNPVGAARGGATALVALALVVVVTWVAGWAAHLTGVAATAQQSERDGDLATAAAMYRELVAAPNVALLPWLNDDLRRAGLYAKGQGTAFGEALQHIHDGENALGGGASFRALAEREFEQASNRLCNVLFDPEQHELVEAVRRFLLRETSRGEPEFRRRIAMDTWAAYLSLQADGVPVPTELAAALRRCLDDVAAGRSETRQAAVAALGGIPTRDALSDMVDLIGDPDLEVADLARKCATEIYSRVYRYRADSEYLQIDGRLMARWEQNHRARADKFPLPADGFDCGLYWRLACYERQDPRHRMATLDETRGRELMDRAHGEIDELLGSGVDIEDPCDDADGGTDRATYRYATGRALLLHDVSIWRPPVDALETTTLFTGTPNANSMSGRLDFQAVDHGQRIIEGTGTVAAAQSTASEHRPDIHAVPTAGAHLRMLHPGYSRLQVRTVVPASARFLRVRVFHNIGSRHGQRAGGRATCRLGILGETCDFVTAVPVKGGTSSFGVNADLLKGRDELVVVLHYLHGNTSYWIRKVELEWREEPIDSTGQ